MLSFKKKQNDYSREELMENLKSAQREMEDKENYFKSVTDPDLVDYAIFDMEASKLKYIYLLKKIRQLDKNKPILDASSDG